MDRIFTAFAHRVASWSGQPLAFILAASVVIGRLVTGPLFHYSDTWQLVINTGTTIVTFLMVLNVGIWLTPKSQHLTLRGGCRMT